MTPERIGRYEILEEIGRGAMGTVYKARDPLLDRALALKTVSVDLEGDDFESFERRFYREARSAGRLSHPNIVTIHDVGKSDGLAYIAMEFLQGRSLRTMLDLGIVFPPDRVADIAAQIADGLAFAHDHGVVHRDIKPANIMVLDAGPIKIMDFGIALLPTGSATLTGNVFGSPKYMSPEQIVGQPVNGRADIFSLGAVLYEMLTGFAPFWGSDLDTVFYQVINEMPPAPSTRNKRIPAAFDMIVARAMAKHPEDRYTDARAMASDLRNYRELKPVSPLALETRTLERRAIRRRKGDVPPAAPAQPATESGTAEAQRRRLLLWGVPVAVVVLSGGAWVAAHFVRSGQNADAAETQLASNAPAVPPPDADAVSKGPATPEKAAPPVNALPAAPVHPASANPKPSAAAKPTARVAVQVSPWGDIYVDGAKKGRSPPLTELHLAPGKHRIEIRYTNFKPYVETVVLDSTAYHKITHTFR
ncbi:MAG TPA: protein kinase [Casimicrobiaceae bacterium]|jgi:serine/threonine-protein kinase|nr:protein kinase [Casimicrobiaceae bacterium]